KRRSVGALRGVLEPLRALHSGHVGDYVAWLVAGTAALAVLLAVTTKVESSLHPGEHCEAGIRDLGGRGGRGRRRARALASAAAPLPALPRLHARGGDAPRGRTT